MTTEEINLIWHIIDTVFTIIMFYLILRFLIPEMKEE